MGPGMRAGERGVALAELLVAGLLGTIAMAAVTQFFSVQVRAMRVETARVTAQLGARMALDLIVRHLEHVGRDPRRTLFSNVDDRTLPPAIAAASAGAVEYRTNLSTNPNDGDAADAWEHVTFSEVDGTVWMTEGAGLPAALTAVAKKRSHVPPGGLAFTYFDAVGQQVTSLASAAARASVRRIVVAITVVGGPEGAAGVDAPRITLAQDVFLRNVS